MAADLAGRCLAAETEPLVHADHVDPPDPMVPGPEPAAEQDHRLDPAGQFARELLAEEPAADERRARSRRAGGRPGPASCHGANRRRAGPRPGPPPRRPRRGRRPDSRGRGTTGSGTTGGSGSWQRHCKPPRAVPGVSNLVTRFTPSARLSEARRHGRRTKIVSSVCQAGRGAGREAVTFASPCGARTPGAPLAASLPTCAGDRGRSLDVERSGKVARAGTGRPASEPRRTHRKFALETPRLVPYHPRHEPLRHPPGKRPRRHPLRRRPAPHRAPGPAALGPLRPRRRPRAPSRPSDFAGRPPTLWRYRELLPLPLDAEPVTLGEGMTPLLPCPRLGGELGLTRPARQGRVAAADRQLQEPRHDGGRQHGQAPRPDAAGHPDGRQRRRGAGRLRRPGPGMEVFVFMPEDTPVINQMEAALCGAQASSSSTA